MTKDPRLRVRSNFLGGSSQGYVSEARSMKLQLSNRIEVLAADVNMDRSQHEVSLARDPAKNQEETETWCTKVTKKRSSRFRDTQLTQTMHLQFLENGHGEEMVNGLDEGLDACFRVQWTLELLRAKHLPQLACTFH